MVLTDMSENLPQTMAAVLMMGHGGYEMLQYRTDVPRPEPKPDEVLIRVGAAAVNNTDINTRIGWYSKSVTGASGRLCPAKSVAGNSGSSFPTCFQTRRSPNPASVRPRGSTSVL